MVAEHFGAPGPATLVIPRLVSRLLFQSILFCSVTAIHLADIFKSLPFIWLTFSSYFVVGCGISACGPGEPTGVPFPFGGGLTACGPGEPSGADFSFGLSACEKLGPWVKRAEQTICGAEVAWRFSLLGVCEKAQYAMSGTAQPAQPGGAPASLGPEVQERIDAIVKQRLEQAFGSVFGKVLTATERAAVAAEKQANAAKVEGITAALKVDVWKPANREEELRGWREWMFQLRTWLAAHDERFEDDIEGLDDDKDLYRCMEGANRPAERTRECTHSDSEAPAVLRPQVPKRESPY